MRIAKFLALQALGTIFVALAFGRWFEDLTASCMLGVAGIGCIVAASLLACLFNGEPIECAQSLSSDRYLFLGKHLRYVYFLERKPPSPRTDPTGDPENFTEQVFKVPLTEFYHRDITALSECLPVAIRIHRTGRDERMLELEVNPKTDIMDAAAQDDES